jgi:magnesium chelatase family protein
VRARVVAARGRQRVRYGDDRMLTNAALTPSLMSKYCALDAAGARVLASAVRKMSLSARAYDRIRKVARTIADLAGDERLGDDHVAEALQFRM